MATANRTKNNEIVLTLSIEEADALRILTGDLPGRTTEFSKFSDASHWALSGAIAPDYVWTEAPGHYYNTPPTTSSFRKVNP